MLVEAKELDEIKKLFLQCVDNNVFFGENGIKSLRDFAYVYDKLDNDDKTTFFSNCMANNIFFRENGIIKVASDFEWIYTSLNTNDQDKLFSYCLASGIFSNANFFMKEQDSFIPDFIRVARSMNYKQQVALFSLYSLHEHSSKTEILNHDNLLTRLLCLDNPRSGETFFTKYNSLDAQERIAFANEQLVGIKDRLSQPPSYFDDSFNNDHSYNACSIL